MPPRSSYDNTDAVFVGFNSPTVVTKNKSITTASFSTTVSPVPQQQQQEEPTKKSVHFAANVAIRCALHINDFTHDETTACWFSDEEFQAIKADITTAVQMVLKGSLVKDTHEFCRRGLEFRTLEGAEQRQENKEIGWESVFLVQEVQWAHDVYDPDYIANVYQTQTEHCVQVAQFRALRDANEAYYGC